VNLGYYCNARLVSHLDSGGGYRVERYTDRHGHTCAYYDSGLQVVHPLFAAVKVVDLTDSAHPHLVRTLTTPGMLNAHEGLRLNQKRGLLAAQTATIATSPGTLDIYSVAEDCRAPQLKASALLGLLGHESAFAPDGNTFWVSSNGRMLAAVDVRDPSHPSVVFVTYTITPHGLSVSDDGNTLFMAGGVAPGGLVILDVSQVQQRKAAPTVKVLSELTWPEMSIPQNATPFRSRGHTYVLETDEFGGGNNPVGAARIINVDNLRHPRPVSHLRLAVNNRNDNTYTAHYCTLPSRIDPAIVACGFLGSGLRVFDVRDVAHPREVAYANVTDLPPGTSVLPDATTDSRLSNVYSAPAYDPQRHEIWYTDAARGLMVIRLTRGTGINQFARVYQTPGS
jgi:hypothetical protein